MTWKAEVSDSGVQSTTELQEPIQTTEKWRKKIFRASRGETVVTPSIHCFRQWPYHSKIPRAGAAS